MLKRNFKCLYCGNGFINKYRLAHNRNLSFCSKSCAGKSKRSKFYRATDLEKAIRYLIFDAGKYMTLDDICVSLKISSKTITAYNISIIRCNKAEGYKQPRRMFQSRIGNYLEELSEVDHEVMFEDCLSPKGFQLRYDFRLSGTNILIEADGSQHNDSKHPWFSEYYLECDKIKNKYADDHGYILVRIPYTKRVTLDYVLKYVTAAYKTTSESATIDAKVKNL